jgi:hypothetical protein
MLNIWSLYFEGFLGTDRHTDKNDPGIWPDDICDSV